MVVCWTRKKLLLLYFIYIYIFFFFFFFLGGLLFTSHWPNLQHWTGFYIAVYGNFQGLFFDIRGLLLAFRGWNRPEPPWIFSLVCSESGVTGLTSFWVKQQHSPIPLKRSTGSANELRLASGIIPALKTKVTIH